MRPPPDSVRTAPRDPMFTRSAGDVRAETFPVVEAGVGIAGRGSCVSGDAAAVSNRAGSSPVDGERFNSRSYGEAAMRAWGESVGAEGPLHHALIRAHCRVAKRHVEWARLDEEHALSILTDPNPIAQRVVPVHRDSGARNWLDAVVHLLRAALVLALLALAAPVQAQSDETLLLRSCISERSFRTDVDDCLIVAEVVRERMSREGGSFDENLRALAPRLHGRPCTASRAWLCDLDVDCHRPRGLTATWDTPRGDEPSRREACEETVREVREILSGVRVSTCVERPRHWGSREDVRRRELAGYRWRDAVCPGLVLLNRAGFLYRRLPVEVE